MIKIRPHHLICNLCFQGKGYSQEFVQNFKAIHKQLNSRPDSEIEITKGLDDICAKCPEKRDNNCAQEKKVSKIDMMYLKILQLKIGQITTLTKIKNKIKQCLSMSKFQKTCKNCSWYGLGICESTMQKIIANKS